jgi:hypothetical protein
MAGERQARRVLKKKYGRTTACLLLCIYGLLTSAILLFAQHASVEKIKSEHQNNEFFERLAALLPREGWSLQEIKNLRVHASDLDWKQVEAADPALVLRALRFLKTQKTATRLASASVQTQLIWQLAAVQLEMQRFDFDNPFIIRTSVAGLRIFLAKNKQVKTELLEDKQMLSKHLAQALTQALDEAGKNYMQYRLRKGIQANRQNLEAGAVEGYRHKRGRGGNN